MIYVKPCLQPVRSPFTYLSPMMTAFFHEMWDGWPYGDGQCNAINVMVPEIRVSRLGVRVHSGQDSVSQHLTFVVTVPSGNSHVHHVLCAAANIRPPGTKGKRTDLELK